MDNLSEGLEESIESSPNTGKCRICWRTSYITDLMSPCVCSGTQMYTHFECLKQWIQERDSSNKDICDVCQQPYQQIVIKQYPKSLRQWLHEGDDVFAKIFTTFILISFFIYLINMGCIQFVISEQKINAIIRFIQLILIIFFSLLFVIIFLVSIYVFKCEFKEWQTTHMNIFVERINGSVDRRYSDSSLVSYQSSTDTNSSNNANPRDNNSRSLIVNEPQITYGSV